MDGGRFVHQPDGRVVAAADESAGPTNTPMAVIPAGETWRFYYFAGSQRIAMRTADSATSSLVYFLGDHLGSTSLTVNPDGSRIAEMHYTAWGETRYTSGVTPTDYQYTGQRNESAIGLYYYNARWYDPALGRFTQADTIVPGGSQGLDRYAYVSNSPVRYRDPSGHCAGTRNQDPECWDLIDDLKNEMGIIIDDPESDYWNLITLGWLAGSAERVSHRLPLNKSLTGEIADLVHIKIKNLGGNTVGDSTSYPGDGTVYIDPRIFLPDSSVGWSAHTNFVFNMVHELIHVALYQNRGLKDQVANPDKVIGYAGAAGWSRETESGSQCTTSTYCNVYTNPGTGPTSYSLTAEHPEEDFAETLTVMLVPESGMSGYIDDARLTWINNFVPPIPGIWVGRK
ncbi:MAG: hypothetical protein FD146_1292 [Anaerolineaceae bacterium]|nr:MAG: hypothetical protein FD146_1292 [Anaerolineaceae bacterium]